jgi:outer membrane protein assembly factor BamB
VPLNTASAGKAEAGAPPFPADRSILALRRAELNAGQPATVRFTLQNPSTDAVLHVRVSAAAASWLSAVPSEVALAPGERQPVAVTVDTVAANASVRAGGPAAVAIQLAFQLLRPASRDAGSTPVGTGAVYLRLPQTLCPHCGKPLDEDPVSGLAPELCPFCFERLRLCPICGAPNSWLARRCVLDDAHVVRAALDWPVLGGDQRHTGWRPAEGVADGPTHSAAAADTISLGLARRWSYPSVAASRRDRMLEWSAPVAAYGLVAAAATTADGDAHIYAFDTTTGAPLWEPFPLPAPVYPDRGGVSIAAGRLFAAGITGVVTAIDVLRGTRLWETRLDDAARVYGSTLPAGSGPLLVCGATEGGGGCMYQLDPETGQMKGRTLLPGPIDTAPAFADGRAFAHTESGDIVAVDLASGAMLWSANCRCADDLAAGVGFDAAPVVGGGRIFSASAAGTVWCHDAATGEAVWHLTVTNAPFVGTPAYDGSLLYLPAEDGVHLVSVQTGRAVRRYPTQQPVRAAPVVVGSAVYFGCTDGAVYGALPGRSAERLYEPAAARSQIVAALAAADGALFVTATNGVLYVLNI